MRGQDAVALDPRAGRPLPGSPPDQPVKGGGADRRGGRPVKTRSGSHRPGPARRLDLTEAGGGAGRCAGRFDPAADAEADQLSGPRRAPGLAIAQRAASASPTMSIACVAAIDIGVDIYVHGELMFVDDRFLPADRSRHRTTVQMGLDWKIGPAIMPRASARRPERRRAAAAGAGERRRPPQASSGRGSGVSTGDPIEVRHGHIWEPFWMDVDVGVKASAPRRREDERSADEGDGARHSSAVRRQALFGGAAAMIERRCRREARRTLGSPLPVPRDQGRHISPRHRQADRDGDPQFAEFGSLQTAKASRRPILRAMVSHEYALDGDVPDGRQAEAMEMGPIFYRRASRHRMARIWCSPGSNAAPEQGGA